VAHIRDYVTPIFPNVQSRPSYVIGVYILVLGKKYSKIRVLGLYVRSDNRRGFTIYFFNPCFRILLAWDE